ncbi:MAG: class I SAM-dependent methyltransferase [Cyclobacteriaceae bacterium]|nr:class I SAM-dependent methyltransferase [Cyclobacteriaceae bacterium]
MVIRKIKNLGHYFLVRSRIAAFSQIDGWLTRVEAVGLFHTASKLPDNAIVVEIGTWKGKSTYCIAKGLHKGKIFCIDPFDASGEKESAETYQQRKGVSPLLVQFEQRMKELGVHEYITPMKGFSQDFVGKFPVINFLFIDGDHSIEGCDFDFMNYAPYLKKGGFIAFHDYDPKRPDLGPTWVVQNKLLSSDSFKFINLYDTLWVGEKIA